MNLALDRASCGDLAVAESREWIVTNGLGGFAAGTVAGTLTRRYHGILFAARTPPVGRTLLCAKVDATLAYDGVTYELSTDRWRDGTIAPRGYAYLTGFRLEGSVPCWTFACGDALLERRIWMERDANVTYVSHRLVRARVPAQLTLHAFANHRDLHGATHAGDWTMTVTASPDGITVQPFADSATISLRADRGTQTAEHVWYRGYEYAEERARGLDDTEDHLRVATFADALAAGEAMTVAVGDRALPLVDGDGALRRRTDRDAAIVDAWTAEHPGPAARAPDWVRRLVLAADQFVVRRPIRDDPGARSVIAGYPWFGDWGRDTAIALPGLALATGRPKIARAILSTFARFVDGGMLPNFFPDAGGTAEYNTVDAALWYVEAVSRYVCGTGDARTLTAIFPVLRSIVDAYTQGTRFGIVVDPSDGLLRAGVTGAQVTWMDAKVDDWVVTPRIGKPVEVNALWINALRACAHLAQIAGEDATPFALAATRAEAAFERFWNAERGCCYDVIDGPDGDDPAVRPNQVFAVALPIDVLDDARRRAIVDVCAAHLWTPAGLRSLAPGEPSYRGAYGGDPRARDGAYHNGTVWTWLAGPFALAYARVHDDPAAARVLLDACADGLTADAFGTLAEIADGNAPFAARGAFAQAWSVAALLDAWHVLDADEHAARR